MKPQYISLNEHGFIGQVYYPENSSNTAVIVLTGSDGEFDNAKFIAKLFAQRGFVALALPYFNYMGLNDTLELIPLEYVERAAQWLKDDMRMEKIALYGVSKGAEYALSVTARYSLFDSVVAVVPHYCVTEGLNKELLGAGVSSWTYQGRSLPYLSMSRDMEAFHAVSAKEQQMSIKVFYELAEQSGVPNEAVIPVENSTARILLLSSAQDNVWPSTHSAKMIIERLHNNHYLYACKHIDFAVASHVLNPIPPEVEPLLAQVNYAERKFPQECYSARMEAFDLAVEWINT